MIRHLRHHSGCRSLLARFSGLPGPPAVVVVQGEHRESGFEVFQLLAEAIGQPVEPFHEQSLGAVEPFNVRCAYREQFAALYATVAGSLRSNHL